MSSVTLIGEDLAKEGLEFVFGGCLSKCKDCELKNSCCGLEQNRVYRVTGVRDRVHGCKVHHKNVKVVDVEHIPVKTAVSGRTAIQGSMVTLEDKKCNTIECENYRICHPVGVEFDTKYNVEKVGKKLKCPIGRSLKEVELI